MKKHLLTQVRLLIMCSVSILYAIGCNRSEPSSVAPTTSNVNLKLVEELEQSPTNVVWVTYSTLNPDEKALLWHRHLNTALSNSRFSQEQRSHIKQLDVVINADLYKKLGTSELQQFMDKFHEEWFVKAVDNKLFTVSELMKISSLNGIGKDGDSNGSGRIMAPMAGCNCRYGISCQANSCPDNRACTQPSLDNRSNCGIAGTSTCTGKCL